MRQTFGEAEVKGQGRGAGKVAPGRDSGLCTWPIHQKTRSLELSFSGEIDDRCINPISQPEVVGMEQRWLAVVALTGLGTEACSSAPDQGIQQCGCEHQHQGRSLEQWQQGADADVDHVLQQQPASSELPTAGFFSEGEQGMAEIARH